MDGYDSSGRHITKPAWGSWYTIQQTKEVIQIIAEKYAKPEYQDTIVAIELLNEPLAAALESKDALKQFYKDGYHKIRAISNTPVVIHDAFQDPSFSNSVLNYPEGQNGKYSSSSTTP